MVVLAEKRAEVVFCFCFVFCFLRGGGAISAISQLSSAQNNSYAKMAYFGVSHSDPF